MQQSKSYIADDLLTAHNTSRTDIEVSRPIPFCFAPSTNLYFGHGGNISACCLNRTHSLGTFPETSIKEAWESSARVVLEQHMANSDLRQGCKDCELDLLSGNLAGIKTKQFDVARKMQENRNYPSMMEFELHNSCNLECVMCSGTFSSSIRKNRDKLPPLVNSYESSSFIEQLREFIPHLKKAVFFGGEPFLVSTYYDIWEAIQEINPDIQIWITTNGTILNPKVKRILEKTNFNITISLDSLNKENYEKIRVNSDLDLVLKNLEYFLEYTQSRNTFFTINTCPMPQNWQDLPELLRFCNEREINCNIIPVHYPRKQSLRELGFEKLSEITSFLRQENGTFSSPVSTSNYNKYVDFIGLLSEWKERSFLSTERLSLVDIENESVLQNLIHQKIDRSSLKESMKAEVRAFILKESGRLDSPELRRCFLRALIELSNEEAISNIYMASSDHLLEKLRRYYFRCLSKYQTSEELSPKALLTLRVDLYIKSKNIYSIIDEANCRETLVMMDSIAAKLAEKDPVFAEWLYEIAADGDDIERMIEFLRDLDSEKIQSMIVPLLKTKVQTWDAGINAEETEVSAKREALMTKLSTFSL